MIRHRRLSRCSKYAVSEGEQYVSENQHLFKEPKATFTLSQVLRRLPYRYVVPSRSQLFFVRLDLYPTCERRGRKRRHQRAMRIKGDEKVDRRCVN